MPLFGNDKCCFVDGVAVKMLIGHTIKRWKWNEWARYLLKCLDPLLFWVAIFWRYKTYRDRSIYGREYSSNSKLIGKKGLTRLRFFLTLMVPCSQFSVSCMKQWRTTFALKIRFEHNNLIPLPYQFKREDMRLNLHRESIDWNEAF